MRPVSFGSPSLAKSAGMCGVSSSQRSTLGWGPMCMTTKMAAAHGTGSAATIRRRGSSPPADAAIATMPTMGCQRRRPRHVPLLNQYICIARRPLIGLRFSDAEFRCEMLDPEPSD
jgi:hypothetical protein